MLTSTQISNLQKFLASINCFHGGADGVMDESTIRSYQDYLEIHCGMRRPMNQVIPATLNDLMGDAYKAAAAVKTATPVASQKQNSSKTADVPEKTITEKGKEAIQKIVKPFSK